MEDTKLSEEAKELLKKSKNKKGKSGLKDPDKGETAEQTVKKQIKEKLKKKSK